MLIPDRVNSVGREGLTRPPGAAGRRRVQRARQVKYPATEVFSTARIGRGAHRARDRSVPSIVMVHRKLRDQQPNGRLDPLQVAALHRHGGVEPVVEELRPLPSRERTAVVPER